MALRREQDLRVPSNFAVCFDRKPESVKSPFESLIMYLELAMKRPGPIFPGTFAAFWLPLEGCKQAIS